MADRSRHFRRQPGRWAGVAAAACFALALAGFGAALPGYDGGAYPVAVLGAAGVPRAAAFNACAFIVPGLLAACVALRGRSALAARAPVAARLGWTLALLATLAFAAQGLFPLEAAAPDAGRGRLHGAAWAAWSLAFAAAAAALCAAALRAGRPLAADGHAIGGDAVFVPAWVAPDLVHPAAAQRAAFAAWFAWLAGAGWATGAARA